MLLGWIGLVRRAFETRDEQWLGLEVRRRFVDGVISRGQASVPPLPRDQLTPRLRAGRLLSRSDRVVSLWSVERWQSRNQDSVLFGGPLLKEDSACPPEEEVRGRHDGGLRPFDSDVDMDLTVTVFSLVYDGHLADMPN